jgi:signal peptidase II
MKITRGRWLALTIALIVAVDWITKAMVQERMPLGVGRPVVDGWLSFVRTVNHGISWGWLKNSPDYVRAPLVIGLTLVGIGATVGIMRASRDRWLQIAGALVLGGALGNLGDRLVHGGVTDYIFVHFFPFIFNFADIAITVGGVLLAARMLLERPHDEAAAAPTHA